MRLHQFKGNPRRGTWELKTLALHERDTSAAHRRHLHGDAKVWMIEADTRREALERCEADGVATVEETTR